MTDLDISEGELAAQVQSCPDSASKVDHISEFICKHLAQIINDDPNAKVSSNSIDRKKTFKDLGLKSLGSMKLMNKIRMALGPEYDTELSPTALFNYPTVYDITQHICSLFKPVPVETTAAAKSSVAANEPIAIVGIACKFPGGVQSAKDYWNVLARGEDVLQEVPRERWNIDSYYNKDSSVPGTMYARRGGWLSDIGKFDAGFFGISGTEATAMDPQQRLLMETCWEAIENAGIAADSLIDSQTGIFVGMTTQEYMDLLLRSNDVAGLEGHILTGNYLSIASGRLAYFLGLKGPALTIDTACSSSLVAVHLACQSLRSGESNMALVSGVNLMISPETTAQLSRMNALSPDGKCKTFDKDANGYVRSEGVATIVLKPLSVALEDGSQIHALILGSAVNQDGKSSGLTAPNGLAQEQLIRKALLDANVQPNQVSYIETHGTGTPLGDPIEVDAIRKIFGGTRDADSPLILGSAKSMIGHAEAAAGLAGLIKVALCMSEKQITPNLHFNEINPNIVPLDNIPAKIATRLMPWDGTERIAGVSSFGFSGTNAHVILGQAPEVRAAS